MLLRVKLSEARRQCSDFRQRTIIVEEIVPGGPGGLGSVHRERHAAIGFGVARGRRPGDFAVAVRAFEATPAVIALVAEVQQVLGEEADVQFLDPVRIGPDLVNRTVERFRQPVRPLAPGYSVGHVASTAGTIGAFVVDRVGNRCLLSNAHVLANMGQGRSSETIVQPGPADGGGSAHVVGWLGEQVVSARVDAALAILDPALQVSNVYEGQPLRGLRRAVPFMPVWKVGRSSGVTQGEVHATELEVTVDWNGELRTFVDQIEIRGDFSDRGDSGAAILDADGYAVGLLFGVTSAPTRPRSTYANHMATVLVELGAQFLG